MPLHESTLLFDRRTNSLMTAGSNNNCWQYVAAGFSEVMLFLLAETVPVAVFGLTVPNRT